MTIGEVVKVRVLQMFLCDVLPHVLKRFFCGRHGDRAVFSSWTECLRRFLVGEPLTWCVPYRVTREMFRIGSVRALSPCFRTITSCCHLLLLMNVFDSNLFALTGMTNAILSMSSDYVLLLFLNICAVKSAWDTPVSLPDMGSWVLDMMMTGWVLGAIAFLSLPLLPASSEESTRLLSYSLLSTWNVACWTRCDRRFDFFYHEVRHEDQRNKYWAKTSDKIGPNAQVPIPNSLSSFTTRPRLPHGYSCSWSKINSTLLGHATP